jgi:hypothetical protein
MILKAECPFCDWSARQDVEPERKEFIRGYLAKALIGHLHLTHARYDKKGVDEIFFSTIMGQQTNEGLVEMSLNEQIVQMDLNKAREVHRMLGEAIEASVSDWLIMRFFTEKIGWDREKAARVLMDFRELRQGNKKGERAN